ncbi:445_t:CDS:2 [Funneliformis caledonium]|uniref:445_t:CDS:1 n=1 Tax=Funneliformis caledonium TaxID=1117310 RepID=A0A9N9CF90_9GLOM|nr:445_t:CDS:2 [Funneliformis caledonium]
MVHKKNKKHIQFTPSANETQSRSLTVTDTELQKLVRQGLIVDEVHEVLSYDRKSMHWVDNFINLSIKLENQCDDPREKAYHALMRELFSMKLSHGSVATLRQVAITEGVVDLLNDAENKASTSLNSSSEVRNYTFDEMCFSVAVDIRSLGGNIKISTVKSFYNGVSGSKVSTVNQINA